MDKMKEHLNSFNEEKLKEAFKIKQAYSAGEIPLDLANAQMKAHVGTLTAAELAYIEQTFQEMADDECIKESIEQMMAIYDGVLIEEEGQLIAGHPIQNYIDENAAIKKLLKDIDVLLEKKYIKNQWDEHFERLNKFKVHLSRKQNQLYTYLERKGFDRPTTTMWLYDNEIRDRISGLIEFMYEDFDVEVFKRMFDEFKEYILDLMKKEETVLYPTSLELLDEKDFEDMVSGDKEIGYCLIEPKPDYENTIKISERPNRSNKRVQNAQANQNANGGFTDELAQLMQKYNMGGWTEDTPMNVKQGILSLKQINLVFQHLPVDISYVDENELVAFYSDTKHRVFPRSAGVIGRDVKNCHPTNSVHIVEEIIEKFRSGQEDKVEFWINKPGMFIYIIYVAVRDEDGNFKGVMEMMQDCTRIRSLQDSQTLLDWGHDNEVPEEKPEEQKEETVKPSKEEIKEERNEKGKIVILGTHTKLVDVFDQYPGLKDYMVEKSEKFAIFNTPIFSVMKNKATTELLSQRTGISVEKLQEEFTKYIENLPEEENIVVEKKEPFVAVEERDENGKIIRLGMDTKLVTLVEQYPGLRDYMVSKSSKFAPLKTPVFDVMKNIATLEIVSGNTGIPAEKLQEEFTKYIESLKDREETVSEKAEEVEELEEMIYQEERNEKGLIVQIGTETKLLDVLEQYPNLKAYMLSKSEKFAPMNTPMFEVMKKVATVELISARTEIPVEILREEFVKYISNLDPSEINMPTEVKEEAKVENSEMKETTDETGKIVTLALTTKVDTVLNQYPGLKDYMVSKSDKFSMMNSFMFKIMRKVATVETVIGKTGIPFERLQEEFTKYIESLKK